MIWPIDPPDETPRLPCAVGTCDRPQGPIDQLCREHWEEWDRWATAHGGPPEDDDGAIMQDAWVARTTRAESDEEAERNTCLPGGEV